MHPVTRSSINDILAKADNQPRLTALESIVITGLLDSGQYKIGDRIDFPSLCMDIIQRRKLIDDLNAESDSQKVSALERGTASRYADLIKSVIHDTFEGLPNNEETRAAMADTISQELTRIYNDEAPPPLSPENQAYMEQVHQAVWDSVSQFLPPEMVMNRPKKDHVSPMAHHVNSAIGRGYGLPIEGITPEEFAQELMGLIKA